MLKVIGTKVQITNEASIQNHYQNDEKVKVYWYHLPCQSFNSGRNENPGMDSKCLSDSSSSLEYPNSQNDDPDGLPFKNHLIQKGCFGPATETIAFDCNAIRPSAGTACHAITSHITSMLFSIFK